MISLVLCLRYGEIHICLVSREDVGMKHLSFDPAVLRWVLREVCPSNFKGGEGYEDLQNSCAWILQSLRHHKRKVHTLEQLDCCPCSPHVSVPAGPVHKKQSTLFFKTYHQN